jgi:hypothetical protein
MTRPLQITISGSSNEELPIPENPPEGIVVTEPKRRMAFDGGGIILIFVAHITGVPFGILSHWLYDTYFKDRSSSRNEIMLNAKHREFETPKELETILEEELRDSEREPPHDNGPTQ